MLICQEVTLISEKEIKEKHVMKIFSLSLEMLNLGVKLIPRAQSTTRASRNITDRPVKSKDKEMKIKGIRLLKINLMVTNSDF